jgi:hypothetical protein
MFSPISLNLDQSPGRRFLFSSGYDTRLSTYYSPNGDDLSDSPRIRSMFQRSIGKQNIERQLDKLAQDSKAIESLAQMQRDINGGLRGNYEPEDYYHIMKIDAIFERARQLGWAPLVTDPAVVALRDRRRQKDVGRYSKQQKTKQIPSLLEMYK